jgi:transposase
MQLYVGLDVHSKSSVFVIQDESGKVLGEGKAPSTPAGLRGLRDRYQLPPGTAAALESGTNAFFVADELSALELSPRVIDAAEVRARITRPLQKSDRRDAFELCDGLRRGIYRSEVWVPPPTVRRVRQLLSRRRHFVNLKTAQVNAVKRLLRESGQAPLSRRLQVASGWEKLLHALADQEVLQGLVRCHQAVWLVAAEQVKHLEVQLTAATAPWQPELDRLMTVPGAGQVVATTFLAVVFDARRFATAKQVASYVGLVPSTFQSGERERHGHITGRGSSELRSMLCEAAQHAQRISSPLNPYYAKIKARHGYRMAIVAVAHRLCRLLYAMLRDGTAFDLAQAGVEEGQFQKVSVRHYRLRSALN